MIFRLDCNKCCFILKAAECADFCINIQESPTMVCESPLRTFYKSLCTHQYWVVTNDWTFWGPAGLHSTQNTSGKLLHTKQLAKIKVFSFPYVHNFSVNGVMIR